jgi:UDP-N-acetylmuramate dehydrogenase
MLVADAGFDGLAIRLSGDFEAVEIDRTTVRAGGAAPLPVLARRTVAAGLTGFEWAVGVPGSVGGAVRMNAGGHGSDMAAALKSAELVDLSSAQRHEVEVRDLDLGYRHSNIRSDQLVAAATLELTRSSTGAGERELSEIVAWRREHQPGGANAGSVFANPEGDSAGRLIDAAGCKGLRIGSAEVSTKHANFIQADSDGSGDDVAAVMCAVRAAVREQFGVNLRAETRVVGFAPDVSEAMGASQ